MRSTLGNGTVFPNTSATDVSRPRDENRRRDGDRHGGETRPHVAGITPRAFPARPTKAAGTDRRRATNVATAIIHALRTYAHPEALVAVPHTGTTAKT